MRLVVVVDFALILDGFKVEELGWILDGEVVEVVLGSRLLLLQVLLELLLALPVESESGPQPVLGLVWLLVLAEGPHKCPLCVPVSGAIGLDSRLASLCWLVSSDVGRNTDLGASRARRQALQIVCRVLHLRPRPCEVLARRQSWRPLWRRWRT